MRPSGSGGSRWWRAALLALAAGGCGGGGDGRAVVTVYSPHGPDLLQTFEQRFEQQHPAIDVQWVDMGSQEVLDRLRSEKANPQADVWFGAPSQLFETAAREGLLAPYSPPWATALSVPTDAEGRYYPIYLTPEVIAYNREAVDSASVPKDWDQVLDPRWKGKVVIRDPIASGTMRTIFGMIIQRSIRETGDTAQGFQWLRRLHGQTREYVLNPTLLYQKLARQEGVITLWDMPDIEMLKAKTGYPIDYVFPTSGTPVVADGIAVVQGAPNPTAARTFVDFVGSRPELLVAARQFFRIPARRDVPVDSLPPSLQRARETVVPEPMDWKLLEERGAAWMRHWDEHVRGGG